MGALRDRRWLAGVLAAVLVTAALGGCAGRNESAQSTDELAVEPSVAPQPEEQMADSYGRGTPSSDAASPEADRMIIRSQTIRLEVKSTPDTIADIRELAKTHSAIVTDLQMATDTGDALYRYDQYGYSSGSGSALRGWVTVRVPAEALDAFVIAAMGLGDVKYQSEGTEDVTQQHVDLSARLENLRAEEVRLRGFFDAAKNVQEMLAIETELNRVRQEIESLDAQVKYLERQAAMATVTIELSEEPDIVSPEGEDWGFREAFTTGIRGAMRVITFGLTFLITTSPLWGLAVIVLLVLRAIIVRRRRVQQDAAPAETAVHDDGAL